DDQPPPPPSPEPTPEPQPQLEPRPVIRLLRGRYVEAAVAAEKLALERELPIYSRSARLCRPIVHYRRRYDGRIIPVAVLEDYNPASLRRVLDYAMAFEQSSRVRTQFEPCDPPKDFLALIIEGGTEIVFKPLRGIPSTPIFRPNGVVHAAVGYDEQTGL